MNPTAMAAIGTIIASSAASSSSSTTATTRRCNARVVDCGWARLGASVCAADDDDDDDDDAVARSTVARGAASRDVGRVRVRG